MNRVGLFLRAFGTSMVLLAAASASANTVNIVDPTTDVNLSLGSEDIEASCTTSSEPCIVGWWESATETFDNWDYSTNSPDNGANTPVNAYNATAFALPGNSSAEEQTDLLNMLLGLTDTPDEIATGTKTDFSGGDEEAPASFTTDRQYFSIKKQDWIAYFLNTSGGEVTVTLSPEAFSNCTEYGPTVVPLPAAAWLFLSGLAGLFGWRRYAAS